ncbi:helix-turn-helix domain-containing protein [Brevibacillus agri]|uniref:helix-turn-helix domain-containing protein n=1 Tax=Brevibacillus agri TaxID=51101 RepID=UPI003D1D2C2B
MEITNEFGSYLRNIRTKKGLTARKLAELSGVSQSYITNVENGKRGVPSPDILKKLAGPLDEDIVVMMDKAGHLAGVSEEDKMKLSIRANLEVLLEHALNNLTVDNHFFDFLADDINKIQEKYKEQFDDDFVITPDSLRELVANADGYRDWIFDFIKEFIIVARKHDLDYQEILRKRQKEERLDKELLSILHRPNITYNGHPLTDQDKQLLTAYLDALFRDRISEK